MVAASAAHPAIAGLALDIVGAVVIAAAVIYGPPKAWVAGAESAATQAALQGIYPRLDREHANLVADTRTGAFLSRRAAVPPIEADTDAYGAEQRLWSRA